MQKKIFLISQNTVFLMLSLILSGFLFSGCSNDKNDSNLSNVGNFEDNFEKTEENSENFILKSENYSYFLDLTGELRANKETGVSAKQGGRIAEMNFEVGDFVFQNTLLGKLAGDESRVNYQTASTNEINLRNLLKSQEKLLDEGIKNARKSLEIAEENLKAIGIQKNNSSLTTEEQKKFAEKKMEEAKVNLENVKINNEKNLKNVYKNGVSEIRSGFLISSQVVNFLDNLLGITEENKHKNDSFEGNLGTLKTSTKIDAEKSARIVIKKHEDFEKFFNEEIKNKDFSEISHEKINEGLNKILLVLENLQTSLQDSYDMLDKSTSGANFSETQLQNLKNQNLNFGKSVEGAISGQNSGVRSLITQINNVEINNQNSLRSAQSAFNSAKQALAQISASSNQSFSNISSQKEIVEKQVEQARIALQTAIANKESSLKDLRTKIDLASGNKKLSQVAIGNTQIGSPFNGVITEKIGEVGQVVAAGQPVYKVADISKYKVLSDISDSQIGKLKIGQEAEFFIDGLGGKFSGKLTKIYPKVDEISRKIKLEFEINEVNNSFKIGSFARIKLKISDKNAFFIPKKFLNFDYNGGFIFDENGEKKYVKVGDERIKNGIIEEKIRFPGKMEGKKIILK